MKKLLLLLPVFASLILAGCGSSATPEKEVVEEKVAVQELAPQAEPNEEKIEEKQEEVKSDDDHPHNDTEGDNHHDNDQHGDMNELFAGVIFTQEKEQTIDGYNIVIKHKDDPHAGDKFTRTITVTQGGNPIDGFEKIDGDDGVGVVKDPVDHLEHLHPLANTNNTLTFSSHTHDAGEYEVITQFQHNGIKITVPYKLTLLDNIEGHHD